MPATISPPEFTMDDYRESFASPRCPPPRPPTKEKSWIPFRKLGLLRHKQIKPKPVTTGATRPVNMDVVKRNAKGRDRGQVEEGDDFLELLATGRDAVPAFNQLNNTTYTPTPTYTRLFNLSTPELLSMRRIAVPDVVDETAEDSPDGDCPTEPHRGLSELISPKSNTDRPQTRPTPTRANTFSMSTPDLLTVKRSAVSGTICGDVGASSGRDYPAPARNTLDPFAFDSVLSKIMDMFPIPPGGLDDDPDRTIRPRKQGCSRTRVDSHTSFSTATSSMEESATSSSGCSRSTGISSLSKQSLEASTQTQSKAALRTAHAPIQTNHTIAPPARSIMHSAAAPNFTRSISALSPTSLPVPREFPRQHTSPPPSQPRYSDSNPPPVPPKDRIWLGCERMGEKTSVSGSDSEVDQATLKPSSRTYMAPQGHFLNRKVNHD